MRTLVAERLMNALAAPFNLDGKEAFHLREHRNRIEQHRIRQLRRSLRDADTAMYRAKSLGKARYELFDLDMRASVIARLQLETDLRNAIGARKNSGISINRLSRSIPARSSGSRLCCAGSIPARGLLQPSDFIPVAEETGMIRELGWWNLQEACRQIGRWNACRDGSPLLTMSVNLSVKQFATTQSGGGNREVAARGGASSERLKLEITESTVMTRPFGGCGNAVANQIPGRPAIHRRLRHWLLFAELSAPLSTWTH